MLNAYEELKVECVVLKRLCKNDDIDKVLALCLTSKISFAYKHKLITTEELDDLRSRIKALDITGA